VAKASSGKGATSQAETISSDANNGETFSQISIFDQVQNSLGRAIPMDSLAVPPQRRRFYSSINETSGMLSESERNHLQKKREQQVL
jgi:hypothetical protein